MIPGFVLILGGVLTLLVPGMLAWLMAITSIVIGFAVLMVAGALRRFASQLGGPPAA
jgi:hypothetical protein